MLNKSTGHLISTVILSTLVMVATISINVLIEETLYSGAINESLLIWVTGERSFISYLCIILWSVTSTVCFFAAALLSNKKQKKTHQFLVYSALLSTYLLFDDFFELHDRYFPALLSIDENIIYVILGVATSSLLIRFRQIIFTTNYIVMLLAFIFFALSIASDGILKPMEIIYGILVMVVVVSFYLFWLNHSIFKEYLFVLSVILACSCFVFLTLDTTAMYSEYLFEEGTKWMGIACWCSYYTYTAYQLVNNKK